MNYEQRKIAHAQNAIMRATYGRNWSKVKRELRKSGSGNVVRECRERMIYFIAQQQFELMEA